MPDDKYKSISGRKVFFINPTISIENFVIDRLQTMEYEVYVLKDYRTAKSLFAEIQEGICFVCPDAGLSKTGWHNFIKYFENNIVFKNFDFGIFSESIAENRKAEITRDLKLTAGFFSMLGNGRACARACRISRQAFRKRDEKICPRFVHGRNGNRALLVHKAAENVPRKAARH